MGATGTQKFILQVAEGLEMADAGVYSLEV